MSNRDIHIERTYFLGNYKNIKFYDNISGIPQNLWTNPEVMGKLYNLIMVSVELGYRRYLKLNEGVGELSLEDSIAKLEELKDDSLAQVKALLTNGDISGNLENQEVGE